MLKLLSLVGVAATCVVAKKSLLAKFDTPQLFDSDFEYVQTLQQDNSYINFTIIEQFNSKGYMEYYGRMTFGTNKNLASIVFDVGFDYTVITSSVCTSGCGKSAVYNLKNPTGTFNAPVTTNGTYDDGTAWSLAGALYNDTVCFGTLGTNCINGNFVAINQTTIQLDFDGIIGLSNDDNIDDQSFVWQLSDNG